MAARKKYEDVLNKHNEYMNDGKHSSDDWDRKNDDMINMLSEAADDNDRRERKKSKSKWVLLLLLFIVIAFFILLN